MTYRTYTCLCGATQTIVIWPSMERQPMVVPRGWGWEYQSVRTGRPQCPDCKPPAMYRRPILGVGPTKNEEV